MDNKYSTSLDVRLINRAIKERWPIPNAEKPVIINSLIGIIKNAEAPNTHRISAVNALQKLDALNIKHEENSSATLSVKLEDMSEQELREYLELLNKQELKQLE